jgi:hypothetical protein
MTDVTWWWIALAAGLAVALVATVLLQLLYRQVQRIERTAERIWHTGKQVAGHTANTWQLQRLAGQLDELSAEAGRHARLLRTGSSEEVVP